jgi:hypothetical protein
MLREAAPVLYGQEFRFSSSLAWLILFHFINTIGTRNTSLFRNITVRIPFNECASECRPFSTGDLAALETMLCHEMGFKVFRYAESDRFPTHLAIVRVCEILERSGQLQSLKLILGSNANVHGASISSKQELLYQQILQAHTPYIPTQYPVSEPFPIWAMLQRVVIHNPKLINVEVLRLRSPSSPVKFGAEDEALEEFLYGPLFYEAQRRGWVVRDVYCDGEGRWPVVALQK